MLTNKQDVNKSFVGMKDICISYEDLNLAQYTDMQTGRLIFCKPENA
jgi:hypothetical protein